MNGSEVQLCGSRLVSVTCTAAESWTGCQNRSWSLVGVGIMGWGGTQKFGLCKQAVLSDGDGCFFNDKNCLGSLQGSSLGTMVTFTAWLILVSPDLFLVPWCLYMSKSAGLWVRSN